MVYHQSTKNTIEELYQTGDVDDFSCLESWEPYQWFNIMTTRFWRPMIFHRVQIQHWRTRDRRFIMQCLFVAAFGLLSYFLKTTVSEEIQQKEFVKNMSVVFSGKHFVLSGSAGISGHFGEPGNWYILEPKLSSVSHKRPPRTLMLLLQPGDSFKKIWQPAGKVSDLPQSKWKLKIWTCEDYSRSYSKILTSALEKISRIIDRWL